MKDFIFKIFHYYWTGRDIPSSNYCNYWTGRDIPPESRPVPGFSNDPGCLCILYFFKGIIMQTAFAQIASQVLMPQWKCMHNYSKVKSFRDDSAKVKENTV